MTDYSKSVINDAIDEEYGSLILEDGDSYASNYEAYGLIKERVESIDTRTVQIKQKLHKTWEGIKADDPEAVKKYAHHLQTQAYYAALNAIEIAVMAKKLKGEANVF